VTFKLRSEGRKEPGKIQAGMGAGAKSVQPGSQREQTIVSKWEMGKYWKVFTGHLYESGFSKETELRDTDR